MNVIAKCKFESENREKQERLTLTNQNKAAYLRTTEVHFITVYNISQRRSIATDLGLFIN